MAPALAVSTVIIKPAKPRTKLHLLQECYQYFHTDHHATDASQEGVSLDADNSLIL
jgi:hypothetical protein